MSERDEPAAPAEGLPVSPSDDADALKAASPPSLPFEIISPATESLPDTDREETSLEVYGEYYVGPIPHPHILRQYGEIIPDGPNRILVMAEKQFVYGTMARREERQPSLPDRHQEPETET